MNELEEAAVECSSSERIPVVSLSHEPSEEFGSNPLLSKEKAVSKVVQLGSGKPLKRELYLELLAASLLQHESLSVELKTPPISR